MTQRKHTIDAGDVLVVIGAALVADGVWQIYSPAALILIGLALIWFGIGLARSRGR